MSLGTILLIVLVVVLLGGFSNLGGGPGYSLGHGANGVVGLLVVIVVILLIMGRL